MSRLICDDDRPGSRTQDPFIFSHGLSSPLAKKTTSCSPSFRLELYEAIAIRQILKGKIKI